MPLSSYAYSKVHICYQHLFVLQDIVSNEAPRLKAAGHLVDYNFFFVASDGEFNPYTLNIQVFRLHVNYLKVKIRLKLPYRQSIQIKIKIVMLIQNTVAILFNRLERPDNIFQCLFNPAFHISGNILD